MSEDFYRVDVVTRDRKGRNHNLHSFVYEDGAWVVYYPESSRQYRRGRRADSARRHPSIIGGEVLDGAEPTAGQRNLVDTPEWWEPRRPLGELFDGDPLDAAPVPLAEGLAPHGTTLSVILDALRHNLPGPRVAIDIDRLPAVLSQLGKRITALRGMPDDLRGKNTPALFAAVVRLLCEN